MDGNEVQLIEVGNKKVIGYSREAAERHVKNAMKHVPDDLERIGRIHLHPSTGRWFCTIVPPSKKDWKPGEKTVIVKHQG